MRVILAILSVLISVNVLSQNEICEIDLSKIPQKKVRRFIEMQLERNKNFIDEIRPCCPSSNIDMNGYCYMSQQFLIKDSLETVWQLYENTSPDISWNGNIVSFGLLLSKQQKQVMYAKELSFSHIEPGQVYIINLKLLKGIYNMAVGIEVTEVDHSDGIIRFSYLEDGKTSGRQTIKLISTIDGATRVIHSSVFKSHSNFRDKHLYPYFHRRIVNEFHNNIANILHNNTFNTRPIRASSL